jgi:acyl-CoA reductase-like NAD-dependent aldehyde dehydrogenase
MGDVRAADEISAEAAREIVDKLLEALDDFDDEGAKELTKILSGYPFRLTQAEKLKEAASFIEDFMYDEAAGIIRQIAPAIE